MKNLLIVAAAVAVALLFVAGAVFGLHDRQMFVPPPEAVVESFTREVVERRYELATVYLSRDIRARIDADELAARFEPMRQQIGIANQVSAEPGWMQDSDAAARALVSAESGSAALEFRLHREEGLWRITQLPSDIPAAVTVRRR
jgi:hypothetical protein